MENLLDQETRSLTIRLGDGLAVEVERARLLVEEGPDQGAEFLLPEWPATLGRGREADFPLRDPAVSRAHLRVLPCSDGWRLEDLGSRSGTYLGGERIETAVLEDGARLRLGGTLLVFRVGRSTVRSAPEEAGELRGQIGASDVMRRTFGLVRKLADMELPVLVRGESGTGKEGLAEALHHLGPHRDGPFVVVDCTLLERDHLRSELFGHVRGAFTGATRDRPGAFVQARGGTLLLDEVGDLPLELQPALLRVLEQGEVRPLGADRSQQVRTRVVAATHRDLAAMVREGRFRGDLYYRLAGVRVEVPPLRDRGGDVLLLARHFLPEGLRLSPEAQERLVRYPWPGNVRELRHALQVASHLCEDGWVRERDLSLGSLAEGGEPSVPGGSERGVSEPLEVGSGAGSGLPERSAGTDEEGGAKAEEEIRDAVRSQERRSIEEALERAGGNRSRAARLLGIDRSTLYRKMKRLGLRD